MRSKFSGVTIGSFFNIRHFVFGTNLTWLALKGAFTDVFSSVFTINYSRFSRSIIRAFYGRLIAVFSGVPTIFLHVKNTDYTVPELEMEIW
jgi:hypothetical protein